MLYLFYAAFCNPGHLQKFCILLVLADHETRAQLTISAKLADLKARSPCLRLFISVGGRAGSPQNSAKRLNMT